MLNYHVIENVTIHREDGDESLHFLFASFRNEIDATHYMEETLRMTEYDNSVMSKHYSVAGIIP